MKVSVRLVGYFEITDDIKYVYQIIYENEPIFNFDILKKNFLKYGIISKEELDICISISNSKNLKKESIKDDNIVYIYCLNQEVKDKLIAIFKSYGEKVLYGNTLVNTKENVVETINTHEDLCDEIDFKPNIELFTNNDFINLTKIYKTNPDIFTDFYKFISSEGSMKESCAESTVSDTDLECIKKYNFNITDDYIRESLIKNNNNLGLTLKYILSQNM
jgi:hypothetical protein